MHHSCPVKWRPTSAGTQMQDMHWTQLRQLQGFVTMARRPVTRKHLSSLAQQPPGHGILCCELAMLLAS